MFIKITDAPYHFTQQVLILGMDSSNILPLMQNVFEQIY